jgi:hypothetical protein
MMLSIQQLFLQEINSGQETNQLWAETERFLFADPFIAKYNQ